MVVLGWVCVGQEEQLGRCLGSLQVMRREVNGLRWEARGLLAGLGRDLQLLRTGLLSAQRLAGAGGRHGSSSISTSRARQEGDGLMAAEGAAAAGGQEAAAGELERLRRLVRGLSSELKHAEEQGAQASSQAKQLLLRALQAEERARRVEQEAQQAREEASRQGLQLGHSQAHALVQQAQEQASKARAEAQQSQAACKRATAHQHALRQTLQHEQEARRQAMRQVAALQAQVGEALDDVQASRTHTHARHAALQQAARTRITGGGAGRQAGQEGMTAGRGQLTGREWLDGGVAVELEGAVRCRDELVGGLRAQLGHVGKELAQLKTEAAALRQAAADTQHAMQAHTDQTWCVTSQPATTQLDPPAC